MKLRKILAVVLCVAMVLSTMSFSVFADAEIEITADYAAKDGDVLKGGTGIELITVADDAEITLSGVNVQRITLNGDAIINLADGTTNNVGANGLKDGAVVVPKGGSLVINGDTGVLNALKGNSYSAAIGSDRWGGDASVTVTINGGVINAKSNYAAAIGGGKEKPATVVINGGTINAESGYGSAIGGGQDAEATVSITNGTVDAISSWGAAIGAGQRADADITISGGVVSAQGLFGAAIGAGKESTGTTTISIENAEVTATVDPATHKASPSSTRGITSAAIGASDGKAEITITDSTVNATSVNAPAIGGGLNSTETSTVVITGESDVAVMASAPDFVVENSIGNATSNDGVTIDDSVVVEEVVPVAQLGDGRFATLQAALDAVKAGNNEITLLADCDENVIIHQKEGINITIKGDGVNTKYTGSMEIYGYARHEGTETVTIDGIYFDGSAKTDAHDFIHQNTTDPQKRYAHNVTIKNCHFEGSDNADVVATRFRQCYNIVVEKCTFSNLHSAMWATGGGNGLTFDSVEITDCKNGISTGTTDKVVVKNSQIEAIGEGGYGVRTDGTGAYSLTVENTDVEAYYPVIVRKAANSDYALNVEGECDFTATNPEGYDIAVTSGSDDKPLVKPENDINITIDKDADVNVFSSHVAELGGILYTDLRTAIDAAKEGDVIDLLGGVVDLPEGNGPKIKKDLTIQNGTIDITDGVWNGNSIIEVYGGKADDFVVATFNNVDFVGDNYSSAFGVIYAHSYGKVVINGCDFDLSNERFGGGGVLKGNGVSVSAFDVTNSTFDLENPSRIIANATVNLDGVKIDAAVTDASLAVGDMNNHAFRNLVGTVKDSDIYAEGFETGIKNTDGDLVVSGDSLIVLTNSAIDDIVIGKGIKVEVKDDAELHADTSDIAADAVVEGEGFIAKAEAVYVQFKKTDIEGEKDTLEGADTYEIVLASANSSKIHELASADLTFDFNGTLVTGGKMSYTVAPAEGVSLSKIGDRYLFNYDGVTKYEETGAAIVIGTITVDGYGKYTLATKNVTTNAVYATEFDNNIVEGYESAAKLVINADMAKDDGMVGKVEGEDGVIAVPTRELTITIDFPNTISDNAAAYQDMKVEITGNIDGVNQTVTYDLGKGADAYAMNANGSYVVTEDRLVLNNAYTVVVSGAGYRTVRYTVTMTEKKALRFWNNVADKAQVVEIGEDSSAVDVTFLAGDIVKDNKINIYDLSAVVSYFGRANSPAAYDEYAKYDLDRNGVIDSKDVAYVLVSWDK